MFFVEIKNGIYLDNCKQWIDLGHIFDPLSIKDYSFQAAQCFEFSEFLGLFWWKTKMSFISNIVRGTVTLNPLDTNEASSDICEISKIAFFIILL